MSEKKRRRGDRYDAYRVHDADAMHVFMPYLLPNRADNEAVLNEKADLTEVLKYVEEKNSDNPEFKYTVFHVICAAIAKVMTLRPKMNYFYSGRRLYERKDLSFAFVVKKRFADGSPETLAIVKFDRESDKPPVDFFYEKVKSIVYGVRKDNKQDGGTDIMDSLKKLPRFVLRLFVHMLNFLEFHGWLPKGFLEVDPYHASVFISNLGSIKMNANYHHLANWGTNSFFAVIGEIHKEPVADSDGNVVVKDVVDLGLTIDERIADGVYFAKSVRLLRKLLANPHLLDLPLKTEIDFE